MELPSTKRSPELADALGPGSPIIVFDRVSLAFDEKVILHQVSFTLITGHTKLILGASGAGKSTILKLILGLLKPDSGMIWVYGERVDTMTEEQLMGVRADLGMVFQEGALFDSLTVRENVGYKLYEETDLALEEIDTRVREVLGFIGLGEYIDRMPSELSGGQRRRVAIARAMCAKPRILLYDEPTTGLDPITSITVDDEIIKLRDLLDRRDAPVARCVLRRDARGGTPGRAHADRARDPAEVGRGRVHHAARWPDRLRGKRLGAPRGGGTRRVRRTVPLIRDEGLRTKD